VSSKAGRAVMGPRHGFPRRGPGVPAGCGGPGHVHGGRSLR